MRTVFFAAALLCASCAFAQDPFYTQYNSGWSMVNPAYAGSLACGRAEVGYRLQWPAISSSYQTMNLAYDQYFRFGGAGFNYTHDAAGQGVLKTDRFDFNYSYGFGIGMDDDLKPLVVIQPGVQFSYYRKTLDWDKLNFGDQIDPRRGFVYNTTETPVVTARNNVDFSFGLLAYSKRIAAGIATFHLTEPDEGFFGPSALPRRYVLHAAGIIGNADAGETGLSIIPSVLFMKQGNFEQLALMATAKYTNASIGVGYRNLDAVLFTAGYTWHDMTLSYSYDLPVSKLVGTGGSHEIHFTYRLFKDQWSDERRSMQAFF